MINTTLLNRKLVKPCTPIPQNLKIYKLSSMDVFLNPFDQEIGVLLFYADSKEKRIIDLEESLAKVLVQFYPLAGRYVMKDRYIDCSDQGAEFLEAEAPDVELATVIAERDVELATVIAERDLENLAGLFPRKNQETDEATHPLLSIQITQLKCDGAVIGISISHRIFDASSMSTFVRAWSSASKDENMIITPIFDSSSWFPLKNHRNKNVNVDSGALRKIADTSRFSIKRLTFNKEAISKLKSKLKPKEGERGWSRVRVVCPVIAKAFINVDRAKHGGRRRPCFIMQAVNIRERTIPPLPNHSCGNLLAVSHLRWVDTSETDEIKFEELVCVMSEGLEKTLADCADLLSISEDGLKKLLVEPFATAAKELESGEVTTLTFTDWSKFGLYEVDFGWGKPEWVSILPLPIHNSAVLMETRDGDGIEVWVDLEKSDMALFEQDEEIGQLAT